MSTSAVIGKAMDTITTQTGHEALAERAKPHLFLVMEQKVNETWLVPV
jgi:hypothetical protein